MERGKPNKTFKQLILNIKNKVKKLYFVWTSELQIQAGVSSIHIYLCICMQNLTENLPWLWFVVDVCGCIWALIPGGHRKSLCSWGTAANAGERCM